MSKRVFDNDRSMYNLNSLRLDVVENEENSINNSIGFGTRRFKVIGSGSFGSICKGIILKSRKLQFQADPEFRILGNYHGHLLSVHSSNKHPIPLQEEDVTLIIQVAVKQMLKEMITEMEKHELIREASNLKVLWGRRNFVTIYGVTKSHDLGCLCLVMDFVCGCNLNEFLRSRGQKLDLDAEGARMCGIWESSEVLWWIEKLKLFREIVIALIVCHREKLYHGDLKGANILLDKSFVPKLVDFGLSSRSADVSYLRSVGGSLFWCAPEVADPPLVGTIHESEVVADPYPSDVYSLGMVLAEIMLDGNVPNDLTDEDLFKVDKWEGGCPISLEHVNSRNLMFTEKILNELKKLIDRCCEAERKDRISLHDCLSKVNHIFSDLCSCIEPLSKSSDHTYIDTKAYEEMVLRFNKRFPSVPDCMILNPSWNMVMDDEENLLVHYFCKVGLC